MSRHAPCLPGETNSESCRCLLVQFGEACTTITELANVFEHVHQPLTSVAVRRQAWLPSECINFKFLEAR